MPRPVVLISYFALCGVSIFYAQQTDHSTPSALYGPVPLHLPSTQALRENAAALITPQATTGVTSVVNAASFTPTNAPGSLSIVYGVDLALPQPTTIVTSVKVNNVTAPVIQSAPTQLTIQMPRELSAGAASVSLWRLGKNFASSNLTLAPYAPAIFTLDNSGQGRASAENAQGVQLSDANLAVPGTAVSVYANGLGPTVPTIATGQIPASPLPTAVTPQVFVAGQQAAGVSARLTATSLGLYKVTFTVPAATGSGDQPIYLQIGTQVSNIATIPVRGSTTAVPPSAVSISPSAGAGSTQVFSAVYSDGNGAQDIAWAQLLFAVAPDGGGQPFCFVHYDRGGNGLWLYGDGGFFQGPVTPGNVSAALQSSACAVNTSGATVSSQGGTLTVNVPITFKAAFTGTKKIYLRAFDRTAKDTGSIQRGTFTVTTPQNQPLSVTPASGSGSAQTFSGTFPDAPGFSGISLGWAQMLFAVSPSGGGQSFCLVHYDRGGNGLWLYGDGGYFLGPVAPGTASNALQNSACFIDTAATTTTSQNGALQWNLAVRFTSAIAGARNTYLRTLNPIGVDTGFVQAGAWTINTTPTPLSVSPASGSGAQQTFTSTYYDPGGANQIVWTQLLLATAPDGGGQPFCLVHYDRPGNALWLYGDGSFLGPVTPGSNDPPLLASACTLNPAASSANSSGNLVTVSTALTFTSLMPTAVQTYLRTLNAAGFDSNWQLRGSFNPTAPSSSSGDTDTEDDSAGIVTLQGITATSFNPTSATARLVLTNATFSTDPADVVAWNNGTPIPAANIVLTGSELRISGVWVDGRNSLSVAARDTNGQSVDFDTAFWCGVNSVDVSVMDGSSLVSGASVKALAIDEQTVGAVATAANGTAHFNNVPSSTLVFIAQASGNRWGSYSTTGTQSAVTVPITGLGTPSPIANNDFSAGTAGWNVGSAPVSLIPHASEGAVALPGPGDAVRAASSDLDLVLTTSGVGPQSVSRTFTAGPQTKSIALKYRFITSEVPGGYFGSKYNDSFAVSIRSGSGAASEANSMNGLGLGAFDTTGATAWRELSLPTVNPGDTIQVDVTVSNVGDGYFDSAIVLDAVGEGSLTITKLGLYDKPNFLKAGQFDMPMRFLSTDRHSYLNGKTEIHGTLGLRGRQGDTVTAATLEVLRGGTVESTATLAPAITSSVLRTFDATGVISIPDTLLFLLPSAAQEETTAANNTVTLRLRVKTSSGEEVTQEYGTAGYGAGPSDQTVPVPVNKLARYTKSNRYPALPHSEYGGDDWVLPTVKALAAAFPNTITWNDFSNMNGGAFAPHGSHQIGVDVDGYFNGYSNPAKAGAGACHRWPLTATAATSLLGYLNNFPSLDHIQFVFAAYNLKDNSDAFAAAIKTATLADGRPATAVIRPDACHDTHFHIRFLPD